MTDSPQVPAGRPEKPPAEPPPLPRPAAGWAEEWRAAGNAGAPIVRPLGGQLPIILVLCGVVLILVIVAGTLAVMVAVNKHQESVREQEKQDREIQSRVAAPGGSRRKDLTKAQEEQIRLRLQALYTALYSLPTSGPVDQLPNVMQQQANLTAEISHLEALLADPAEPK